MDTLTIELPAQRILTAHGVRAADVAWASPERVRELGELLVFPRAAEIALPGFSRAGRVAMTLG